MEPFSPFAQLGEARVRAIVESFYDVMSESEPALARLHECDPPGVVARGPRDRFAMFLIGWLGGPQDYMATYGHPRLPVRHARVRIDEAMRDAWTRSMTAALERQGVTGPLREFLDERFAQVADFLRNAEWFDQRAGG